MDEGARRFERMAGELRQRIVSGQLVPGDAVPSVRDLVEEWGTSKVTVDRALALLKAEGLIESRTGARTTVTDRGRPWVSTPREHVERVTDRQPIYAAGETSRKYQAGVLTADNVSAVVLSAIGSVVPDPNLPHEVTTVVQRARIMSRDGEPYGACTTWFNHPLLAQQPGGGELIERLTSVNERFPDGTRREVETLCNVEYTHTVERVGIRPAPTLVARELGVTPGTSMLWVLSTRFANDYPLEADEWFRFEGDDVTYHYS